MKVLLTVLFLVCLAYSSWIPDHNFSPAVSSALSDAIKQKLLQNINGFANRDFSKQLEQDLRQTSDSKRSLKQIDVISIAQLFSLFQLNDPKCDTNGDDVVKGQELSCLNKIWKYYVPK